MTTHFTYTATPDKEHLHQGDILRRSGGLESILQEVHPHYFRKEDYRFFIVLTQSCDLLRRDGNDCSARYITIAAVRPTQLAFERYARNLLYEEEEVDLGFCPASRKGKLQQFGEKLFNNNEVDYFFLRRQDGTPFDQDHCAFLKLSVALRAKQHYNALVEAKVLQLRESFQHKLGYLVGSSYSRVGTDDWLPNHSTPESFKALINDYVKAIEEINWLEKDIYQYVLDAVRRTPSHERNLVKLQQFVKEAKEERKKRRKEFLELVAGVLRDLKVSEPVVSKAVKRLNNKPELSGFLKNA